MASADIIRSVGANQRFRILAVGRSGVGKSSLINRVLGIENEQPRKRADIGHFRVGNSDIQKEFVSTFNQQFVLHDSNGFEPGDVENIKLVCDFIQQRSTGAPPERVHCIWLCTETPPAGGRVFEKGDEELVKFAYENKIPLVIAFTQYDRLVRSKKAELEEDGETDPVVLDRQSKEDATTAYVKCVTLVKRMIELRLKAQMPRYCKVSVRPNYPADVVELAQVTVEILNHGMSQPRRR